MPEQAVLAAYGLSSMHHAKRFPRCHRRWAYTARQAEG
jgi:hypothetical protein